MRLLHDLSVHTEEELANVTLKSNSALQLCSKPLLSSSSEVKLVTLSPSCVQTHGGHRFPPKDWIEGSE